jgi:hypothetical protein
MLLLIQLLKKLKIGGLPSRLGKSKILSPKQPRAKRAGCVALMSERLLSEYKALSSNLSTQENTSMM